MPAPTPLPTYLYKILPIAPPTPLPSTLPLSELDSNDGYIHLSTSTQTSSTASKYFSSFSTLWLLRLKLCVLEEGEGEVKWEEVGRGCFAHLYGGGRCWSWSGEVESPDV
ncbi:hypothetical protein P154DRAFT_64323 [Amniculicola lignicola CBS 123094]|uniref:DUF952 domain-containing protein n=1 Tax=Amniculicola lignicola CBS 123094 TaxID=1392246 RepID=A0A6A5WUY1_9PLEO|nr:hypothetical protein P154DRAFT_64323 [Amniculicola lignicola CBS 123094]